MNKAKEYISLIVAISAFLATLFGWVHERGRRVAKDALLEDQVSRNKIELESHNLDLIEYQLKEMDEKLDKITNLLENGL
jgi:hypothetical protein